MFKIAYMLLGLLVLVGHRAQNNSAALRLLISLWRLLIALRLLLEALLWLLITLLLLEALLGLLIALRRRLITLRLLEALLRLFKRLNRFHRDRRRWQTRLHRTVTHHRRRSVALNRTRRSNIFELHVAEVSLFSLLRWTRSSLSISDWAHLFRRRRWLLLMLLNNWTGCKLLSCFVFRRYRVARLLLHVFLDPKVAFDLRPWCRPQNRHRVRGNLDLGPTAHRRRLKRLWRLSVASICLRCRQLLIILDRRPSWENLERHSHRERSHRGRRWRGWN